MANQVSRSTRLKMADEIIENNGTLAELAEKITHIHEKLIKTCIVSK
jgi:dephospho-CoA kinase